MDFTHPGELAAMATAVLWTGSAVFFETAGRRIGSLNVNLLRLLLASGFLAVQGLVVHGRALPLDAPLEAWGWLSLSSLAGFVIGDLCLFRALVVIGARLSMLIMALAPLMTSLFGWAALGETLSGTQFLGMMVTLAGIAWAVLETGNGDGLTGPGKWKGVALALLGAAGQAGGLVLSKLGLADWHDPFAAAQIRVLTGVAGFTLILTAIHWWPKFALALKDRRGVAFTTAGAIVGPFLGVSMSLLAVQLTQAGVASTIMATTPVLILPVVIFVKRERVSPRAAFGAVMAVAGVAVLFW